jgi:hypothetical protein
MTNAEFMNKLEAMYENYPIIAKNKHKTLNELVYVLRMKGDRDYSISTNAGMCISSVRETFIPSRYLSKKIEFIEWEEFEDEEYGTIGAIIVDLED